MTQKQLLVAARDLVSAFVFAVVVAWIAAGTPLALAALAPILIAGLAAVARVVVAWCLPYVTKYGIGAVKE